MDNIPSTTSNSPAPSTSLSDKRIYGTSPPVNCLTAIAPSPKDTPQKNNINNANASVDNCLNTQLPVNTAPKKDFFLNNAPSTTGFKPSK